MQTSAFADDAKNVSTKIDNLTYLQFDTTPPKMPVNFEISEL